MRARQNEAGAPGPEWQEASVGHTTGGVAQSARDMGARMPEFTRIAGALTAMTVMLSGCMGGTLPFGGDGNEEPAIVKAPSRPAKTEEREAPEAFSLTDTALWDGRPSLGGIWVAHASVTTPEKVIVRNTENGKTIKAALFRRERDFPGPSIQMSSDAAAALGALAGQPVKVSVVALRTVTIEEPPAAEPAEADGKIETKAIDPIAAAASAAIDKADAKSRPVARPEKAAAKPAAKTEAPKTEAPASEPAAAPSSQTPVPEKPADKKPAAQEPEAAVTTEPAQVGEPVSGVLKQPYVQIGTFSSEENAKRAALELSKAGMSAVVRKSGDGAIWRVIVGPALSAAERDALLERVRASGYPDAFVVGG